MNKARKWLAAGLSLALGVCFIGGLSVIAYAEEPTSADETYAFSDFPYHTGYSDFDWYTAKTNVDYKLMIGLFDDQAEGYGLSAFDTWDNTQVTSSAVSGLTAANWKWTFAANSSVVVVMRAKTDGTINVNMSASETFGGWNEAYNTIYSVHRLNASDESLDTLVNYFHGTDTVSGNTETDFIVSTLYDIEIPVKQGDVVYYELGSLAASRNIQGFLTAQISYTPEPVEEITPEEETYSFSDLPYHTGYSGFDWYTACANADYKLMLGMFDASAEGYGLSAFDTWEDTQVTSSAVSGLTVANWKWTFAANSSVVLVIRAKQAGTIAIDFSECNNFGGWMDSYNTIYSVHRLNASDGTLDTLVNYYHGTDSEGGGTPESWTASSFYEIELTVKEGDIVYYEIGALSAGRNVQNFTAGKIIMTPTAAAVDTPDPEVDLVEEYGAQLDAYVETLTRSYYTDESWAQIEGYVTAFKGGTYEDDDAITEAFNTAKANIEAIGYDSAEYFVTVFGAKLDSLVSALYEEDYLAETWTQIAGYVSAFKEGTYSDEDGVIAAYESAAAAIGAINLNAEHVSQTYSVNDLPKLTGQNGFGFTERNNASFKLMTGLFDSSAEGYGLQDFDTWDGANTVSRSDVETLSAINWKWFFGANSSVVIVMQSKIEGIVSFKWSASNTFGGWMEPYNTIYTVHRYNAATQTLDTLVNFVHGTDTVSGRTVSNFIVASVYDLNVMVKEGDIIYYEIGSLQSGRNVQNITASQIVTTPLNDETAGAVYGDLLDSYVAALVQENYTEESLSLIESYVTAFKAETYETALAALNAYEAAIANIDGVEPDSLVYFGALLDELVSSLNEENFEEETWTAINGKVTAFKEGDYADGAAIRAAYEQAKEGIENTAPDSYSYLSADLLAKMENYYGSLNSSYYSEEDWAIVSAAYTAYAEGHESKTDKEALQAFYDEQLAAMKSVRASKQDIVYLDYPTLMSANGFNWIEGDVVDTKLYTGTVKDGLKEFDTYNVSENKMYNSELYGEDPTCYAQTWKWFVGIGKGVIAAYRANTDCSVTVSNTRVADGGNNGWTETCVLNVYIVRDGVVKLLSTKKLNYPAADEEFEGVYYLKEGDLLYIEFTTTTATSARNTESPYRTTAVADASGFDEDLYIEQNHDLPVEVQERIAEKKAALDSYLNGLNEDDYSATNWLLLEDYIDQFAQKCETDVSTIADVDALYESILASMQAIQTKEQAAAELAATLEGYVAELQAEYDALVAQNKYSSENRAILDKALEDGIAAIRAAKTKAAGNTAKSSALAALRAVEAKTSGCSSELTLGAFTGLVALTAAAVAAVIVIRKKKNNSD